MTARPLWSIAGCLLGALPVAPATDPPAVRVRVAVQWAVSRTPNGPLAVEAVRMATGAEEPSRASAPVEGTTTTLDLAPGSWRLRLVGQNVWSPSREVEVSEPGVAEPIALRAWPAGAAHGRVTRTADGEPLASVTVVLEAAPDWTAGERPPDGSRVECPLRGSDWACLLPAGRLDIQVRAKNHVPHYLWAVHVTEGERTRVPPLALVRGASLAGHVERLDRLPLAKARVELRTPDGQPVFADARGRDPLRARLGPRGFFQFPLVSPGDYEVAAEHAGLAGASEAVSVWKDAESRLPRPLRLGPPAKLSVTLTPPLDPWGNPWDVGLWRGTQAGLRPLARSRADAQGTWYAADLSPGAHTLVVSSHAAGGRTPHRWHSAAIDLSEPEQALTVDLPLITVHGTVTLGGTPVAGATVVFGGRHGAVSIPLTTDAEGAFRGVLPTETAGGGVLWDVDLDALDPPVRRSFERVRVEAGGAHEAEVNFRLPRTKLSGRVVDADGRPARALVDDQSLDGAITLVQTVADAEGRFTLQGVPPGPHLLSAAERGVASDPVTLSVTEGSDGTPVTLVLRAFQEVEGEVVSPEGGVAGALVKFAALDGLLARVPSTRTDAHGLFRMRLPGSARRVGVAVGALGYGFELAALPVPAPGSARVNVPLRRQGGSLEVERVPDAGQLPLGTTIVLTRGGFFENLYGLAAWVGANGGTTEGGSWRIPQLAPGEWSVCLVTHVQLQSGAWPRERCASGQIPAGGELRLTVPSAPTGPE